MSDGSLTLDGTHAAPPTAAADARSDRSGAGTTEAAAADAGGSAPEHEAAPPSGWPFLLPVGVLVAVFGLALVQPILLLGGIVAIAVPLVGWLRDAGRELAVRSGPPAHEAAGTGRDEARAAFPGPALGLVVAVAIVATGVTLSLGVKGSTAEAAGPGSVASVANGTVDVTAKNIQFSVKEIDAPAGAAFTIAFRNDDTVPHNIAITDASGKTELFRGDVVTGPVSATYQVSALAAGTYAFRCDVHPGMNGTVVAK